MFKDKNVCCILALPLYKCKELWCLLFTLLHKYLLENLTLVTLLHFPGMSFLKGFVFASLIFIGLMFLEWRVFLVIMLLIAEGEVSINAMPQSKYTT